MPVSRNAGLPLRLISRFSEKTTSFDGERVAVREVHVLLQVERERLRAVRGLLGRDEQRDGMRQVGLVVGEERVEDATVDDRPSRVERTLRIGRLERERVVDDERRDASTVCRRGERGGRACERHEGDEGQSQLPSAEGERLKSAPLSPGGLPGSSRLLDEVRAFRCGSGSGGSPGDCSQQAADRSSASADERRLLDRAAVEGVRAARVEAAAARRVRRVGHLARQALGQDARAVGARHRGDQRLGVGMRGALHRGAVGAVSTIRPRYITRHVVCDVADDRQIVGDQEQPQRRARVRGA